ncbi:hypothetical protein M407DRAFT_22937 [Tulasnella calospora MUT 4182]|uniref:DUF6535 domain-containing protein n=1 Tax=Tulasnella calospora MUT 4182 TaxID=1051891 RepID=A0A0C3QBK3_9AGAM|nr:hypothetical protein M407DRAFT_22937 [Tulasnella calospora MUT 4182]
MEDFKRESRRSIDIREFKLDTLALSYHILTGRTALALRQLLLKCGGIQGALFSAINTAFISISITSLTPDPAADSLAEINALLRHSISSPGNNTLPVFGSPKTTSSNMIAIISNCFLFSSLCCSLLSAMGGMLGKEWLQNLDQAGQDGPLEYQVLSRQEKLNGIQQWHFEGLVQLLPNLLILSVLLFFVGLSISLFPISRPVAIVVVVFVAIAMGLSLATIVAAATAPLCPFQTALSRALRHAGTFLSERMNAFHGTESNLFTLPNMNLGASDLETVTLDTGSSETRGDIQVFKDHPILSRPELTCSMEISYLSYLKLGTGDTRCEEGEYVLKLVFLEAGLQRNEPHLWTGVGYLTSQPYDDQILGMVARMISKHCSGHTGGPLHPSSTTNSASGQAHAPATSLVPADDLIANLTIALRAFGTLTREYEGIDLDLCIAFMRRIREFALQDAIGGAFRESVWKSLPLLSWKMEHGHFRGEDVRFRFWVEWVCLARALYQYKSRTEWDENLLFSLWTALECLIDERSSSLGTVLGQNLVLDFVRLILEEPKGSGLAGLERHPKLLAHMSSLLKTEIAGPGKQEWLNLLFRNRSRLFCKSSDSLQDIWIKNGLTVHVLDCLKASQTKDELYHALTILEDIAISPQRSQKFIEDGFIDAVTEVMLRVNAMQELFDKQWGIWQLYGFEALLCMWMRSGGRLGRGWPTDKLLSAISPALARLTRGMERKPVKDASEMQAPGFYMPGSLWRSDGYNPYSQLLSFISDIKNRRPATALIARSVDIAMNRICNQLGRPLAWNYVLYAAPIPRISCSRLMDDYASLL